MRIKEINVQEGDTLYSLAEKHLGDGHKWRDLFLMNVIEFVDFSGGVSEKIGPDYIWPGMRLKVVDYTQFLESQN